MTSFIIIGHSYLYLISANISSYLVGNGNYKKWLLQVLPVGGIKEKTIAVSSIWMMYMNYYTLYIVITESVLDTS